MENKKILLIEDDEFLRQLYTDILISGGYTVTSAADGNKGLEKLLGGGWDLVLLDMILPGMSGLELAKHALTSQQAKPFKHLVFLTNMYSDDQQKEAMALGDAYLIKIQLTPENFLEQVKKFLS